MGDSRLIIVHGPAVDIKLRKHVFGATPRGLYGDWGCACPFLDPLFYYM